MLLLVCEQHVRDSRGATATGQQIHNFGVIIQVFVTRTHLVTVMEYATGGELFEYVRRSGRLSEDAARFFFQQLISGVDYCHQVRSSACRPPQAYLKRRCAAPIHMIQARQLCDPPDNAVCRQRCTTGT